MGGSGGASGPDSGGTTGAGGAVTGVGGAGDATGSAGSNGSGGATGAAGSTGLGGAPGAGGATGAAGSTGLGGAPGLGGSTGSAGSTGSGGATGGTGGSAGKGGSSGGNFLLLPDSVGDVVKPGAGILGAWYSSTDSTPKSTGSGSCVRNQATACSVFATTSPAQGGAFGPSDSPITVGRMCASGTVAQVVADAATGASPDYSGIWGAVIGLGLNGTGFGSTGSTSNAYDPTAHGIVGVSFDIDMVPYANSSLAFRVEFPTAAVPGTTDLDAAYWNGATSNGSPVTAGQNIILWSNVLGPMYELSAPPFDPTQLLAVQFHVIGSPVGPVPFNFCISNLTALTTP
ncbi:MAG TPA: hypothetical protein VI456_08115 [Polyangia bacterium]